jgi:hypothetical protein
MLFLDNVPFAGIKIRARKIPICGKTKQWGNRKGDVILSSEVVFSANRCQRTDNA